MSRARVPLTLKTPRRQQPSVDAVSTVKADHYRRLGLINTELERAVAELRARAQELRRVENARYRTALEQTKEAA